MKSVQEEMTELLRTGNEFVNEFSSLNSEQINWKPTQESWSIGQCIDHLIKSNKTYFPAIEKLLADNYKPSFWEKINPLTATTGRQMITTLGVEVKKKYKAPLLFIPSKSNIKPGIVAEFATHQEDLIKLLSKIKQEQYVNAVITSPVAKLITLKLSDAIRIIVVHEQRHFQQALRVKNHERFSGIKID
jgi:hypothetical protein